MKRYGILVAAVVMQSAREHAPAPWPRLSTLKDDRPMLCGIHPFPQKNLTGA
jgi:hypothetical protein